MGLQDELDLMVEVVVADGLPHQLENLRRLLARVDLNRLECVDVLLNLEVHICKYIRKYLVIIFRKYSVIIVRKYMVKIFRKYLVIIVRKYMVKIFRKYALYITETYEERKCIWTALDPIKHVFKTQRAFYLDKRFLEKRPCE